MSRDPMCIENDRLVIRSLNEGDLKGLKPSEAISAYTVTSQRF